MDIQTILATLSIMALPLLFAVTLHEAAHGWVANKLGDHTALLLGRVTLNPIKHIDLVGTIILPVVMLIISRFTFLFGWAKPVPVNWTNLHHPRRDMALVALAGPGANLLMALLWAGVAKVAMVIPVLNVVDTFFKLAGKYGILINSVLLVLNLIPIPPLDGSRVISAILPPRIARQYGLIEPYGIWIILGIIFLFGRLILIPPVTGLYNIIVKIYGLG